MSACETDWGISKSSNGDFSTCEIESEKPLPNESDARQHPRVLEAINRNSRVEEQITERSSIKDHIG